MLSRLNIAVRINLLLALSALGMVVCAGIGLMALRIQMIEEKHIQLRYVMDVALNDARSNMNGAGGSQTGSGRDSFLDVIKRAKFGDNAFNFFFVDDYDGVVVWHPDPSKRGVNRSNVVYPNGLKMIQKFIEGARGATLGGYFDYEGPDNRGNLGPKLTHCRDAPDLKFVVCVGIDAKDVEIAFLDRLYLMAWLFTVVMLATGLASVIISRSIGGPLSNAVGKIKKLANGDLDIAPANAADKSELGDVDKALDVLRANAIEQRALEEKVREQNELLIKQHKESKDRWRRFVEQAPVALLMLDRNMVHLASSRRWVEGAGFDDGGIGRHHYDLFPQIPEHWKEAHRRGLAGETVRMDEEMYVRPDGSRLCVSWEVGPWLASDGTIGGITIMSEDVTDRVQAVQALRENELRMRMAQEAAKAGFWESRPSDKINVWSNNLWTLFGLEPGQCEPTRELWLNTIHPDDRDFVEAEVIKGAAAGREFEIQWRVNLPEGGPERWLFARGRPISDETPDNYFGVVIDITEQKLMEQALRDSEMRMRVAQEGAKVGTWEWRLADNSLRWTDPLWSIFNLKNPEGWEPSFEGWSSRIHPASREHAMATVREAATLGHDFEVEWRANLPDDEPERWFLARGRPITDADGKPDRYLGVIIEITGQKLAENALRESEMRMRLAQEAARVGAWEWRLADNSRHLSDSLWNLYGLQKPEGWNSSIEEWASILHLADRERVSAAVMKAVSAGQEYEVEWRQNAPKGEPERWFLTRGRPLANADGNPDRYFGVVIDITKQKLMEQALRHSEMRTRVAQEAAKAGEWELSLADRRLVWPDYLWGEYGIQKPEQWDATVEAWMSIIHPAHRQRVMAAVGEAAARGEDIQIEYRLNLPEGEPERWILSRGSAIPNPYGPADRYFGFVIDITEQKLMEKALRESEERQTFLLSLNDALRATGDPVEAIATASKMLGQKLGAAQVFYAEIDPTGKQALISRDWNDGTVPGASALYKLDGFDASFFGALGSGCTIAVGDVHSGPHRWFTAGQALFERASIVAFIAVPLVKDGKFAALLGLQKGSAHAWTKNEIALAQEVAERTWEAVERARVSQALRENELRLKFALAAGEAGTFELALDTGEIAACDQTLALLNYRPGESMTLESVLARIYPDDLPAFQESLQRTMSGGSACELEWRTALPDGSIRWLETRGEKRSVSGKQVIAGLIQDVTKKVEQKEAVERAAKAKSEFLANMSHELRTPMHAILSFAKFGLKKCATANVPAIEEYFGIINELGQRLLGLLNDLLDLAKLESGKMILKKSRDDFLSVIEQTKVELSPLLNERSISLKTDVLTGNTNSTFDKQRMIQVLVNLISNSIKFSPNGSEICVTVMEGRSSSGAEVLRCSVGDEGPGIPNDELETVFEKFTQSANTKSGAGGTGLGLPICREIVKAHGGHIWAENRTSKGALFSFVVPRIQGA